MPTNLSVSAWIKCTTGGYQNIFADANAGSTIFWSFTVVDAKVQLLWGTTNFDEWIYGTDNNVINDTNWHFVTVTQVGTGAPTFYIDGSSVASSLVYNAGVNTKPTAQGSALGQLGLRALQFFNGAIDEVGIWSRALTSGEVSQLWNGGAGLAYPLTTNLSISLIDSVTISEYKNINVTQTFYVTNPSTAWGLKIIG
jgi:hypothetical protein